MQEILFKTASIFFLFAPVILQVLLSKRKMNNTISIKLSDIAIISLILGIFTPLFATYLCILGLPENTKCITGIQGLVVIGWMINFIATPLLFRKYRKAYFKANQANNQLL
jgi:hypothetical protein